MNHWNHRVFNIKDENNGEDLFVVRETYYDENNEIMGASDLSVMSETLEGLKWIAENIIKSTEQPVLVLKNEKHPNDIVQQLIQHLYHVKLPVVSDLSDIGNEIGIALSRIVRENKVGYELDSFIAGVKHGI